jgi:butyryl-CoA dehydrogenase
MDFALTPEQLALKERAREAALEWQGRHATWDSLDQAPYAEIIESLRDAGLLGLTMPEEYGGKGGTALDYVLVVEELLYTGQSWILGEGPFCSTGPGPSMILLADESTRTKFLPRIVRGEVGCAIALTEPEHGSDLTHLETKAEDDGDSLVVSGLSQDRHRTSFTRFSRGSTEYRERRAWGASSSRRALRDLS